MTADPDRPERRIGAEIVRIGFANPSIQRDRQAG
jgi:hypothetical protein